MSWGQHGKRSERRVQAQDRGMQAGAGTVVVLHMELCSLSHKLGSCSPCLEMDRPLEKDQEVNTSGHICAVGPGHW